MPATRRTIAVSISDSPDREKLGFPAREIDRAFLTICSGIVRSGAEVLYAGDLRPEGFTFKAFRHMAGAYAASGTIPFTHVLPENVLRRTSFADLRRVLAERHGMCSTLTLVGDTPMPLRTGQTTLRLGKGGDTMEFSEAGFREWLAGLPPLSDQEGLTRVRKVSAEISVGRVLMGGKIGILDRPADRYAGEMPGIVQEAILSLEAGRAVIPLGAFGGATRDVAIALGLLDPSNEVPRGAQVADYGPAIARLSALRDRLPPHVLPLLRRLATDDRPEFVSARLHDVFDQW